MSNEQIINQIERAIGIHIISVAVSDLEKSVDFYVKHLGFELKRAPDPYPNAILSIGNSPSIFLHQQEDYKPNEKNNQSVWFEMGTRNIELFYANLLAENVRVSERYDNPGCGKYFDVFDPDGHRIIVCQDWYNRFE
ncbi:VOC family protein [Paenibacillus sp. CC-CFT747]|nr:VOC family protein [Paenibacillus sp. CC-CFT747]